jgi:hypothetical protein
MLKAVIGITNYDFLVFPWGLLCLGVVYGCPAAISILHFMAKGRSPVSSPAQQTPRRQFSLLVDCELTPQVREDHYYAIVFVCTKMIWIEMFVALLACAAVVGENTATTANSEGNTSESFRNKIQVNT